MSAWAYGAAIRGLLADRGRLRHQRSGGPRAAGSSWDRCRAEVASKIGKLSQRRGNVGGTKPISRTTVPKTFDPPGPSCPWRTRRSSRRGLLRLPACPPDRSRVACPDEETVAGHDSVIRRLDRLVGRDGQEATAMKRARSGARRSAAVALAHLPERNGRIRRSPSRPPRVLIASDQRLVRDALKALTRGRGVDIVGEASDVGERGASATKLNPDLILQTSA
jgi:hypothetical protein